MIHCKAAVILETMWGSPTVRRSPRWFTINPHNMSGRRLIWLLGHDDFLVTNACPEFVTNAKEHGKPSPEWVATNLQRITFDLLLVCGNVAQRCYGECGFTPSCTVIKMMHPAARTWTKAGLLKYQELIQNGNPSLRS